MLLSPNKEGETQSPGDHYLRKVDWEASGYVRSIIVPYPC